MRIKPQFFSKKWGYEKTIINNEKYCGKILKMAFGQTTSLHYYKTKDKTYYINEGQVEIYSHGTWQILTRGCAYRISPGEIHQVHALEDSEIIEFSTFHDDNDAVPVKEKKID